MKITTLVENNVKDHLPLKSEHGLSFLIETEETDILFDTGQTDLFMQNAKKLNKDLSNVNTIILSHAHYDHAGGVKPYIDTYGKKAFFYLGPHFFEKKYRKKEDGYRYLGPDFDERYLKEKQVDYKIVDQPIKWLTKDIFIVSGFVAMQPKECFVLQTDTGDEIDTFKDEIAVGIDTPKGIIVLLGCGHPGLCTMLQTIKQRTGKNIRGIIGGTHLRETTQENYKNVIDTLDTMKLEFIGVSHCTGEVMTNYLEEHFKERFFKNHTGTTIHIEAKSPIIVL